MMLALPPAIVAGELVRLQTRQHVVALTFDGGGNADGAKTVLKTLRRERVPATFFLTGRFVRAYPEIARAIGRRYLVANHTVDHPHLTAMSNAARTLAICHTLGYTSVRWTVDTWGWMGRSSQSVPGAIRRVRDRLVPGEIVLMHVGSSRDGSRIDTKALPGVIRTVRERGYRFVTLKGVRPPH